MTSPPAPGDYRGAVIVDSHAHLEPNLLDVQPMLAKMDEAGVSKVALIPAINDPLKETPEVLLSVVRRLMDSRLRPLAELIHRATLTKEGNLRLGGEIFRIYDFPDNAGVAKRIEAHPDRFLGWIFLNPRRDPDVLETLERWRQVPGMIGVKLHPHWHDYRTDLLWPLFARLEELKMPALVHLGFGPRGDFPTLCERHPRVPLISAHAGFPFYRDLWKHGPDLPNLYVDLSSPYIDESLARRAVAALGPERCLYGTDSPYGFHEPDGSYDYGEIRGWVERLPLPARKIERIFGSNFLELVDGR